MLKKIDLAGAPPQDICETRALVLGGSWNRKGIIIFGTDGEGIMQVAAAGGVATRLTTAPGRNQIHVFPSFLPDGRHFVYLRESEKPGVSLGSLDTKPEQQDPKTFLATPLMLRTARPMGAHHNIWPGTLWRSPVCLCTAYK